MVDPQCWFATGGTLPAVSLFRLCPGMSPGSRHVARPSGRAPQVAVANPHGDCTQNRCSRIDKSVVQDRDNTSACCRNRTKIDRRQRNVPTMSPATHWPIEPTGLAYRSATIAVGRWQPAHVAGCSMLPVEPRPNSGWRGTAIQGPAAGIIAGTAVGELRESPRENIGRTSPRPQGKTVPRPKHGPPGNGNHRRRRGLSLSSGRFAVRSMNQNRLI